MLHAGINPHRCKHCGERFRFRKGLAEHKELCSAATAGSELLGLYFDDNVFFFVRFYRPLLDRREMKRRGFSVSHDLHKY